MYIYTHIYNQLGYTYILYTLYIYIHIYIHIHIYIYIYTGIAVYLVYVDILNTCIAPLAPPLPPQLLFPRSSIYNIIKVCYNN